MSSICCSFLVVIRNTHVSAGESNGDDRERLCVDHYGHHYKSRPLSQCINHLYNARSGRVKSYFNETEPKFQDFYVRFRKKFSLEHPEEENHELGIFAVQAYDAIWTVAQALVGNNLGGQHILEQISLTSFHGLTGLVEFTGRRIAPLRRFQIVNMIGRSYRELGFWTSESGFTDTMDEKLDYNPSMRTLGQVFWPGGPWSIPTGWTLPSSYKTLKIGVPIGSVFKFFVNPMYDSENNLSFSGLTIKIFEAVLEYLPYYLPHQFIPFNGSYDALVLQLVHPEVLRIFVN